MSTSISRHAAPQEPKRKKAIYKRWWVWVLAIVVLLIIASAAGGGGGSTSSTGASAIQEPADQLAQVGQPVRDGKFEFIVNGVKCGIPSVGSDIVGKRAQGEFCIVNVTVTNIGNEAQGFFGDNAKITNAGGQEFSADTSAAIYMSENSDAMYAEINPGNTITTDVVFDVPVGTDIDKLELHDSLFSGGIKVQM